MLVSWNWLSQYVPLTMDLTELEDRLTMAGLNHESTQTLNNNWAIDLEVTSNRPDCLGHVGVAREISVLWDSTLTIPEPQLPTGGPPVEQLTKISIQCPELCYRYTARVIRGVKIGPSPDWLADHLRSIGIAVINNVVDITNFVMLECGQPLHAFDFALLNGPEICVRAAFPGEQFQAIDHRLYPLDPGMCVIADTKRAVALAGVMGGVDSEVTEQTTDLLIESAEFAPLPIRTTARKLNLQSPSSYRFERRVDPVGIDWASRRCCQLILELAGGKLADGVLDVGRTETPREPIELRLEQIPRVLGIDVPRDEVERILGAIGNQPVDGQPVDGQPVDGQTDNNDAQTIKTTPPSWRRDLTREIDLIEEVARIHGYDKIPEDVGVPMAPSHRRDDDIVLEKVRQVMVAAGFDEAISASVVPQAWCQAVSPWSSGTSLAATTPMLKGADRLRMSLIPSLLESRRANESVSNPIIELFETARVYLPSDSGLPVEQWTLSVTSGGSFHELKGLIETLLKSLHITTPMTIKNGKLPLLDAQQQCQLKLGSKTLGFLGRVTPQGLEKFGLRNPTSVAEINLEIIANAAILVPQDVLQSGYPAISRDLNLIVNETVRWSELEATVRTAAGPLLESLRFQEVYRDAKKDGAEKKRLLFSMDLRSAERTLTNEQADEIRKAVVQACSNKHKAQLLG